MNMIWLYIQKNIFSLSLDYGIKLALSIIHLELINKQFHPLDDPLAVVPQISCLLHCYKGIVDWLFEIMVGLTILSRQHREHWLRETKNLSRPLWVSRKEATILTTLPKQSTVYLGTDKLSQDIMHRSCYAL
jgi:ABC-type dipeptide/oligopeptide/nickel transport system permease subunit